MTADEKWVVDASVVAKWYVPEPGSAQAATILESGSKLLAPDLLVAELGNIMWKKVRRGELSPTEAQEILDAFVTFCPVTLYAGSLLLQSALDIAVRFERTVYDALYLAVAVAEDCCLVTADARLIHALKGTALAPVVRGLGEGEKG